MLIRQVPVVLHQGGVGFTGGVEHFATWRVNLGQVGNVDVCAASIPGVVALIAAGIVFPGIVVARRPLAARQQNIGHLIAPGDAQRFRVVVEVENLPIALAAGRRRGEVDALQLHPLRTGKGAIVLAKRRGGIEARRAGIA
ncbi:hypothetical protein D3C84_548390 [compost metagenome]